jgi:hypothetical protein
MEQNIQIVHFKALRVLELGVRRREALPVEYGTDASLQGHLDCISAQVDSTIIAATPKQGPGI